MVICSVDEEEIESNLFARYETEEFVYYPSHQAPLHVSVRSATSTVGSNLTSDNRDRTGIMIWPATHLLCQWLSERPFSHDQSETIIELGCGCGLVGVTAKLACKNLKWVSTDMDDKALMLARQNYRMNGFVSDDVMVRNLRWGDKDHIQTIQDELAKFRSSKQVPTIVAADIVYPSTANQVLRLLLDTVDILLAPSGKFYLSFCTRDGYRTPLRLIEAASRAGFLISALDYHLDPDVKSKLPPLLDAKLLVLQRGEVIGNELLGRLDCPVFPGLHAAIQRAAEESSDEEWEPPAFVDGDDEELFRTKLMEQEDES